MSSHKTVQRDDTLPMPGAPRTEFDFPDTFDHSQIPLEKEEWPVIIIGSSMVGMTLQLLLGFHGIKSLSFDRHPSTSTRSRAANFHLRTIEIFRQLGLEPAFREASATAFDLNAGVLMTTALNGGTVLAHVSESDPARIARVTPCRRLWLTQNMYEPWVRVWATAAGAVQRFGERVVHYEENDGDGDTGGGGGGVLVVVEDVGTGERRKYRAAYVVACDGNRSPTRRKERIEWRGPGVLASCISIYFRADLAPFLGTRAKYGVVYVSNPKISAAWRLDEDGKGGFLLVLSVEGRGARFEPDSVSEKEARDMVGFAFGQGWEKVQDFELEEISYFTMAAFNSDTFTSKAGRGRIFLAGDAAHAIPPTGGLGGNTGIQDAHNLAWKLAFVLGGKASHELLASYSTERQKAAGFAMQQAYSRFVNRVTPDSKVPRGEELPAETVELGYRYPTGALVSEGYREKRAGLWEDPFAPTAMAGSRLPHVILSRNGKEISTLDLVGKDFVILSAEAGSPWKDAATEQIIPVEAYAIFNGSEEALDLTGRFGKLCKLSKGQALLVRPDGHIAWKAPAVNEGHVELLKEILERIVRPHEVKKLGRMALAQSGKL